MERCAPTALAGDDLLHIDLRSDNVVFSSAGPDHDVAVDWPHAAIGAAWFPLLAALPSLNLSGAPDPWVLWDRQSLAATADTDDINAALAVLAGCFVFQARLPPTPGIPTLRDFRSRQSAITLDWLRRRI